MRRLSAVFLAAAMASADAQETRVLDLAPIAKWIERQAGIRSIEAEVIQSRAMRTLQSPASAEGKFWFATPSKFRWQIGDPPRTLAIGDGKTVTMIDARRRTAVRTPFDALGESAQNLGMFEFPFAASFAEFRERFQVRDIQLDGTVCRVEMLPRAAEARRFLSRIRIEFDTDSGHLLAFEAVTKEGSSMRNEFRNVRIDRRIDPAIFDFDLTGYDVQDAPR